jgi:hypothetical protein
MSIRCGKCKGRHESPAQVKACYAGRASAPAEAAPAARQEHVSQAIAGGPGSWGTPAEEGVYVVQGRIYRVVVKANGSGRPYAEEMVRGKYVYAKGWVFRLRPEDRLTLAQAKEWGLKEVRCIRCGIELTKPSSREAGIGPTCATKV